MIPKINNTKFGSITVAGEKYNHDIQIRLNGRVEKRKKRLSKEIFGTSHIISLAEAEHIFEEGAQRIIIGTGQSGLAKLSDEAAAFFRQKKCNVDLLPTSEAVRCWNDAKGQAIGLFHITC
jgi:hypothetical protein